MSEDLAAAVNIFRDAGNDRPAKRLILSRKPFSRRKTDVVQF